MNYAATIGLEVHVQLKTHSKLFCACSTSFAERPNSNTCPVCLGLPGALPVVNEAAIRMTILTGLMLGSEIPHRCKFDRKNYFYPDMPRNYQISQYDLPLCRGGAVPLPDFAYPKDTQKEIAAPNKKVRLVRVHIEEDVAKSTHFESVTGIDFNRAGTPLMEIVSEPEIDSPEEAFAYLTALKQILIHGKVSDADMEKGQLRCDCNVSVRPEGQSELGTKIEIKNMNTISGVRRALAYEIKRQTAALKNGETLQQETRRWDEDAGQTLSMRSKEMAHDYRYFPDPDLLPVQTADLIEQARKLIPELPDERRARYVRDFQVSEYDATVLANDLDLAGYFERAASGAREPKKIANWVLNDLQSALAASGRTINECPVPPRAIDELVNLVEEGKINSKQAKEIFSELFEGAGSSPAAIAREKGLEQLSDTGELEKLCEQVIAENPGPADDYRAGNEKSLNYLKGQVMKLSKGKANPKLAGEILAKKL